MSIWRPPEVVREHASRLWVDLSEADGDTARITELLDGAMADGPQLFTATLGTATTVYYAKIWPAILRLLEDNGVTREQVADVIADHMRAEIAEYLRTPVTETEATRGD